MPTLSKDSFSPLAASSPKSSPSIQFQSISATGRITRVSETFAYIKSSKHGGIFVPPAAVLPKEITVNPDLTAHLKSGDIVHFSAVPQKGKNDCNFLATKLIISKSSEQNLDSEYDADGTESDGKSDFAAERDYFVDKTGIISTVNETFGHILIEETQEMVFFPGSAYRQQDGEPNRLNAVFQPFDLVIFSARRQPEMNGCCWIAEKVAKIINNGPHIFENHLGDFIGDIENQFENNFESLPTISERGFIINLAPLYGFIQSENVGNIYFNVLSWCGDTKNGFAESLVDVLSVGDEVLFSVVPQNLENGCVWRAAKVYKTTDNTSGNEKSTQTVFPHPNATKAADDCKAQSQSTQTVISSDNLLFRAVKSDPDLYQKCLMKFPDLIRFANQLEK